jgi:hypothetical protein
MGLVESGTGGFTCEALRGLTWSTARGSGRGGVCGPDTGSARPGEDGCPGCVRRRDRTLRSITVCPLLLSLPSPDTVEPDIVAGSAIGELSEWPGAGAPVPG